MLLRPGNAGSNTFTDHRDVLAAAIRQVPARFRRKILVRVDRAGASHELVKHPGGQHQRLLQLPRPRRHRILPVLRRHTAVKREPQHPARTLPGTAAERLSPRRQHIPTHTRSVT